MNGKLFLAICTLLLSMSRIECINQMGGGTVVNTEHNIEETQHIEGDLYSVPYSPDEGESYTLSEEQINEDLYAVSLKNAEGEVLQQIEVETYGNNPLQCAAFELADVNCDGYLDVPLVKCMGNVNRGYALYLWDSEKKRLVYTDIFDGHDGWDELAGCFTINQKEKTLDMYVHWSACEREVYRFEWTDAFSYKLVKKMHCNYNENLNDKQNGVHITIYMREELVVDDIFANETENFGKTDVYDAFYDMYITHIIKTKEGTVYEGYTYLADGTKSEYRFVVDEEHHLLQK